MITATFNGEVIAPAEQTILLEGNLYVPPHGVGRAVLTKSWLRTLCHRKGVARYHHVQAGGVRSSHAAWSYPLSTPLARKIKEFIAFDPASGIVVRDEEQ